MTCPHPASSDGASSRSAARRRSPKPCRWWRRRRCARRRRRQSPRRRSRGGSIASSAAPRRGRSTFSTRCSRSARCGGGPSSSSPATRACAARSTPTCSASPRSYPVESTVFITAGRKAAQFVSRSGRTLAAEFAYGDSPTYAEARAIAAFARDLFLEREVDQVLIVTTRFVNTLTQEPVAMEYLPVGEIKGLTGRRRRTRRGAARRYGGDGLRAEPRRRPRLPARPVPEHLPVLRAPEREGQRAERADGVDEERHRQRRRASSRS